MKKRFFIIGLLALLFSFALTGCSSNDHSGGMLNINDIKIEGVESPTIDYENNYIIFTVDNDKDKFTLADIKLTNDLIVVNAIDTDGNILPSVLDLKVGLNEFRIKFSLADTSSAWIMKITRLDKSNIDEKKPVGFTFGNYKNSYYIGEEFEPFKVTVSYNNGETKEVEVTLDMLEGFDTSKEAVKKVKLSYEGLETEFTIYVTVKDDSPKVLDISMFSYDSMYYIGEEFKAAIIRVYYDDKTYANIDVTKDMLTGFNTATEGKVEVKVTYKGHSTTFNISVKPKALSMELKDFKTTYNLNETYSKDAYLVVKYNDNKTKNVEISNALVTNFDTSKIGKVDIKISYDGLSIDLTIEVVKKLDYIKVDNFKTEYDMYEKFNPQKLTLVYDDDSEEDIDITSDMLEGFDTNKAGKFKVTIKYMGKTLEYTITVNKVISSIEVASGYEASYFINEEFKGATLLVKYTDNTKEEIEIDKNMLVNFSTKEAGKLNVKVCYLDNECEFEINVSEPVLNKIEILNATTNYFVGDEFKGATLKLTYNDGNTENIDVLEGMLKNFSTKEAGSFTVNLEYEGFKASFDIVVTEVEVIKTLVKIEANNVKAEYELGMDISGSILLTYDDNTTEIIQIEKSMISGYDNSKLGQQTITITYKEKTCTYNIEVVNSPIKIELISYKKEYKLNEDFSDARVKVTYYDKTTKEIDIKESMLSNFSTQKVGSQRVTIKCEGLTIDFTITVIKSLSKINIVDFKSEYNVNEELTKIKIELVYDDKSKETKELDIAQDMNFNTSKGGSFKITVSYEGFTASATYTVVKKVASIEVISFKESYTLGSDFENVEIKVTYDDKTTDNKTLGSKYVTGYNKDTLGSQELTVTYENKSATFTINVVDGDTTVELGEYKNIYLENDEFVGTLIITKNGVATVMNISNSMLSGFDNTKVGKQEVTISYDGFTTTVNVEVLEDSLKTADVRELLAIYYSVGKVKPGTDIRKEFENSYNDYVKNLSSTIVGEKLVYLKTLGFKNKEIKSLNSILKTSGVNIISLFMSADLHSPNALKLLIKNLTIENIEEIKTFVLDLLAIIDDNQAVKLMDLFNMHANAEPQFVIFDETGMVSIVVSLKKVIESIGVVEVQDYFKNGFNPTKMSLEDKVLLINGIRNILTKVCSHTAMDLHKVIELFVIDNYKLNNYKNNIDILNTIIKEILVDSNSVKQVLDYLEKKTSIGNTFEELQKNKNNLIKISFIRDNLNELPLFLDTLTNDVLLDIEALITLLTTEGELGREQINQFLGLLVKFAHHLDPFLTRMIQTDEDKEGFASVVKMLGLMKAQGYALLNYQKTLMNYEVKSKYTDEEAEAIQTGFNEFMGALDPNNNESTLTSDFIIKKGSTKEEFIKNINKSNELMGKNPGVDFNLEMLTPEETLNLEQSLQLAGSHEIVFNINMNKSITIMYYVYDETTTFESFNFGNQEYQGDRLFFIDSSNSIMGYMDDNSINRREEYKLNSNYAELFKNVRLGAHIANDDIYLNINPTLFKYTLSFIPASDIEGKILQGAIRISIEELNVHTYIIVNYYKVNPDNMRLTNVYVGDNITRYVLVNSSPVVTMVFDYGLKISSVSLGELKVMSDKLGEQTAEFNYNKQHFTFTLEVLSSNDMSKIAGIHSFSFINIDNIDNALNEVNLQISYITRGNTIIEGATVNDIIKKLQESFGITDLLRLELNALEIVDEEFRSFELKVYHDEVLLTSFKFINRCITNDEYQILNIIPTSSNTEFKSSIELSDEDYLLFTKKTDDEIKNYGRNHFNKLEFDISGYRIPNMHEKVTNICSYLDSLDIPYYLELVRNADMIQINLIVKDSRTNLSIIKKSVNRETAEIISMEEIDGKFSNPKWYYEPKTKEEKARIIADNYSAYVKFKLASATITGDDLYEFLIAHEIGFDDSDNSKLYISYDNVLTFDLMMNYCYYDRYKLNNNFNEMRIVSTDDTNELRYYLDALKHNDASLGIEYTFPGNNNYIRLTYAEVKSTLKEVSRRINQNDLVATFSFVYEGKTNNIDVVFRQFLPEKNNFIMFDDFSLYMDEVDDATILDTILDNARYHNHAVPIYGYTKEMFKEIYDISFNKVFNKENVLKKIALIIKNKQNSNIDYRYVSIYPKNDANKIKYISLDFNDNVSYTYYNEDYENSYQKYYYYVKDLANKDLASLTDMVINSLDCLMYDTNVDSFYYYKPEDIKVAFNKLNLSLELVADNEYIIKGLRDEIHIKFSSNPKEIVDYYIELRGDLKEINLDILLELIDQIYVNYVDYTSDIIRNRDRIKDLLGAEGVFSYIDSGDKYIVQFNLDRPYFYQIQRTNYYEINVNTNGVITLHEDDVVSEVILKAVKNNDIVFMINDPTTGKMYNLTDEDISTIILKKFKYNDKPMFVMNINKHECRFIFEYMMLPPELIKPMDNSEAVIYVDDKDNVTIEEILPLLKYYYKGKEVEFPGLDYINTYFNVTLDNNLLCLNDKKNISDARVELIIGTKDQMDLPVKAEVKANEAIVGRNEIILYSGSDLDTIETLLNKNLTIIAEDRFANYKEYTFSEANSLNLVTLDGTSLNIHSLVPRQFVVSLTKENMIVEKRAFTSINELDKIPSEDEIINLIDYIEVLYINGTTVEIKDPKEIRSSIIKTGVNEKEKTYEINLYFDCDTEFKLIINKVTSISIDVEAEGPLKIMGSKLAVEDLLYALKSTYLKIFVVENGNRFPINESAYKTIMIESIKEDGVAVCSIEFNKKRYEFIVNYIKEKEGLSLDGYILDVPRTIFSNSEYGPSEYEVLKQIRYYDKKTKSRIYNIDVERILKRYQADIVPEGKNVYRMDLFDNETQTSFNQEIRFTMSNINSFNEELIIEFRIHDLSVVNGKIIYTFNNDNLNPEPSLDLLKSLINRIIVRDYMYDDKIYSGEKLDEILSQLSYSFEVTYDGSYELVIPTEMKRGLNYRILFTSGNNPIAGYDIIFSEINNGYESITPDILAKSIKQINVSYNDGRSETITNPHEIIGFISDKYIVMEVDYYYYVEFTNSANITFNKESLIVHVFAKDPVRADKFTDEVLNENIKNGTIKVEATINGEFINIIPEAKFTVIEPMVDGMNRAKCYGEYKGEKFEFFIEYVSKASGAIHSKVNQAVQVKDVKNPRFEEVYNNLTLFDENGSVYMSLDELIKGYDINIDSIGNNEFNLVFIPHKGSKEIMDTTFKVNDGNQEERTLEFEFSKTRKVHLDQNNYQLVYAPTVKIEEIIKSISAIIINNGKERTSITGKELDAIRASITGSIKENKGYYYVEIVYDNLSAGMNIAITTNIDDVAKINVLRKGNIETEKPTLDDIVNSIGRITLTYFNGKTEEINDSLAIRNVVEKNYNVITAGNIHYIYLFNTCVFNINMPKLNVIAEYKGQALTKEAATTEYFKNVLDKDLILSTDNGIEQVIITSPEALNSFKVKLVENMGDTLLVTASIIIEKRTIEFSFSLPADSSDLDILDYDMMPLSKDCMIVVKDFNNPTAEEIHRGLKFSLGNKAVKLSVEEFVAKATIVSKHIDLNNYNVVIRSNKTGKELEMYFKFITEADALKPIRFNINNKSGQEIIYLPDNMNPLEGLIRYYGSIYLEFYNHNEYYKVNDKDGLIPNLDKLAKSKLISYTKTETNVTFTYIDMSGEHSLDLRITKNPEEIARYSIDTKFILLDPVDVNPTSLAKFISVSVYYANKDYKELVEAEVVDFIKDKYEIQGNFVVFTNGYKKELDGSNTVKISTVTLNPDILATGSINEELVFNAVSSITGYTKDGEFSVSGADALKFLTDHNISVKLNSMETFVFMQNGKAISNAMPIITK